MNHTKGSLESHRFGLGGWSGYMETERERERERKREREGERERE